MHTLGRCINIWDDDVRRSVYGMMLCYICGKAEVKIITSEDTCYDNDKSLFQC